MAIVTGAIYVDALGDIFSFYERFSWYDQLAHFLGGLAAAGVIFSVIYSFVKYKKITINSQSKLKLSYKEKIELEQLPQKITQLENEQSSLQQKLLVRENLSVLIWIKVI